MDFTLLYGDKSSIRLKSMCMFIFVSFVFLTFTLLLMGTVPLERTLWKGNSVCANRFCITICGKVPQVWCVFTFLMLLSHAPNPFSHQKLSLPTPKRILCKKWKIWACKQANTRVTESETVHFLKFLRKWSVSQNHVLLEPQNLSLEAGQTELLEQMGLLTDINLPTSNEIQSLVSDSTLFDWFCTAYFLSHWKMKI